MLGKGPQVECWMWARSGGAQLKPLSEVSTRGAVLGSLNTRFFSGNRSQEGQIIFFFDPSILNVNEDCRTEPVFPRCVSSLAEGSPRILGCHSPEQAHCPEEGLVLQVVVGS